MTIPGTPFDLLLVGTTMAVAAAAVPVLARVGPRVGLVDLPDVRKRHVRPVPLVGGCAFTLALVAALLAASAVLPAHDLPRPWFFAAVALVFFVGAIDDACNLPPGVKGVVQIAAAVLLLVPTHLDIVSLGAVLVPGRALALGAFALPYSLLCLVGYVNAFNMLDGVDGLAGGVAVVTFGFLAAAAWLAGAPRVFVITLASVGAVVGFLAFNLRTPWRRHAAVFLGDQGSLVLGLILGWAAIRLASPRVAHPLSPMAVAWILALPVIDTLVVMTRRILRRQSPFHPDRTHLHHLLLDLGLAPGAVTAVMSLLAAGYAMLGLGAVLWGIPDRVLFAAAFLALVAHAVFGVFAERAIARRAVPEKAVTGP